MKDKVGYGRVLYLKERKKGVKDVPSEELPDISSKRTNVTPVASQFRVQATPDWRKIKLHHGPLFYVKATQHSEKTVEELITFTTELDARKYKRILDENGEEVEPTSLVGNRCYFLVVLIKGTAWRMDRGDQ
ncbi:uncharacterized protein [Antedon mediterranea]|uniref:uncharacterized protein n=1 Tax=Antedon mediterranea TaxID=105859 RepID=UPI003AF91F0F